MTYTRRVTHIRHRSNIAVTVDSILVVYYNLTTRMLWPLKYSIPYRSRFPSSMSTIGMHCSNIRQHRFNQHPTINASLASQTQPATHPWALFIQKCCWYRKDDTWSLAVPKENITKSYPSCCISPILTPLSDTDNGHRQVNFFSIKKHCEITIMCLLKMNHAI